MMNGYHTPVLLKESIDFLLNELNGTYVDATFGGGGHTKELLSRLGKDARVIAFDVDDHSQQIARELSASDQRLSFVERNFADIDQVFREANLESADGFLFDLGMSSHQIDNEAGFSYRRDEKLDMRLDKHLQTSAYDIVNTYEGEKLTSVFTNYGEERRSRALAKAIVSARKKSRIETTSQLAVIIEKICGKSVKSLSRIFQALRIEVNREIDSLAAGLVAAIDLTVRGGRIVVISYHSLEDRVVKEKFKYEAATCICPPQKIVCTCGKIARIKILTRKPVPPGEKEIVRNRRARSAKMRVAEKII